MSDTNTISTISDGTVKKLYLKAFLYSFILFIVSFLPILLISEFRYFVYGDYSAQNIPFWHYILDNWRNGWPTFDMTSDLGMNFITAYSYYGLTSPFILLGLLVPKSALIYAMTFINASVFGTASLGACMYCKRYTKKDSSALICGLLYAYSGVMVFNLVFQFADSFAIFPFLLLSFDLLIKERKSFVFAVTLMLAGFINYFFLWADCLFIAIYFFVKLAKKEFKMDIKLFFKIAFEIITGIGMTAFILLPTFLTLLTSNTKASISIFDSNPFVYFPIETIPRIIQSFFLPPDICNNGSLFSHFSIDCNSVAAYIPLFGIVGFISVLLKNKREWYSYLLYVCAIIMAIPVLNSAFVMFNAIVYLRWIYMPVLIMIMMTGKFLDDFDEYKIKGPILTSVIMIAAFAAYWVYLLITDKFEGYAFHFIYCLAFGLLGLAIVYQLKLDDKKSFISRKNLVKIVVVCCCFSMFGQTFFVALNGYWEQTDKDLARIHNDGNEIIIEDDEFFRTTTWSAETTNCSLIWNMPSICYYNSMIHSNVTRFWADIGIDKFAYIDLYMDDYPVATFLSCKYDLYYNKLLSGGVTVEPENIQHKAAAYKQIIVNNRYIVLENECFIPMGFTFDYFIDSSSIVKIDISKEKELDDETKNSPFANRSSFDRKRMNEGVFKRQMLLLKGIWLDEEQIEKYSDILSPLPEELFNDTSVEAYITDCKNRKAQSGYYFKPTDEGFISKINLERDNLVFYSVPYDESFTAYVDGKEVEIENVFNGLCAVKVPQGDHTIEFIYTVSGLDTGIIISIISAVLFIGYIAVVTLTKKKNKI